MSSGTISPSMIWVGNTFQFDIEALIPINRPSGSNGVIAQLHLYLNDIDPRGTGKPLFGGPVQPASPFRGIDQPHPIAVSATINPSHLLHGARTRSRHSGLGKVASRTPMSVLPPASVRSVPMLCSQARRRGPFHCALSRAVSLGPLKGGTFRRYSESSFVVLANNPA